MARFLDVHPMKGLDESLLKKILNAPVDEIGVIHFNILYNPEADQCFCLLEAPTMEAVQKHHGKFDIKCDWIMKVKTTAQHVSNFVCLLNSTNHNRLYEI